MFSVSITEKGGAQRSMDFTKPEVHIGRVQGNDIILPKGNVSKRHARLVLKDGRLIIVDLKSTNGTYVDGRKITAPVVIKEGNKVYIGDFVISVTGMDAHGDAGAGAPPPMPPMSGGAPPPGAPTVGPGPMGGPSGPPPGGPPPGFGAPPALNDPTRTQTTHRPPVAKNDPKVRRIPY